MSDEEKVVNWLEENYKGIILGLIIGISILYGYKTYVSNQNSHQLEISRLYDLAIESYTNGDPSSILSFSKRYMDSDPSNIYTQLASFYSAKIMYEKK